LHAISHRGSPLLECCSNSKILKRHEKKTPLYLKVKRGLFDTEQTLAIFMALAAGLRMLLRASAPG
jgi:hypothetical protein